MKKYLLIFLHFLFLQNINAQISTPFELYTYDYKILNPAFAGVENTQSFNAFYKVINRKQVSSPSTTLLSYDNQLQKLNSGIGIIVENTNLGALTGINWKAIYNYQIALKNKGKISIGAGLSYLSNIIDYSKFRPSDPNDPLIGEGTKSFSNFDLDMGFIYYSKSIYGGLSVKNIFKSELIKTGSDQLDLLNIRHLHAILGYNAKLNNWLSIKPSLVFSSDNNNQMIDANISTLWYDLFVAGMMYRRAEQTNIISFNGGINIHNKLQVIVNIYSSYYRSTKNNFELSVITRI